VDIMARKAAAKVEAAIQTVVAKFDDSYDAEKALRKVTKALRDQDKLIYEGGVVALDEGGELEFKDMRDIGLTDIIVDAADTTISVGLGGLGLVMGVAMAGLNFVFDSLRLVKNNAGQVIGLAGEVLAYPNRKLLSSYRPGAETLKLSKSLKPGETAVVVTADPDTAANLATELARSGGQLL
jgi:hypothetical protein